MSLCPAPCIQPWMWKAWSSSNSEPRSQKQCSSSRTAESRTRNRCPDIKYAGRTVLLRVHWSLLVQEPHLEIHSSHMAWVRTAWTWTTQHTWSLIGTAGSFSHTHRTVQSLNLALNFIIPACDFLHLWILDAPKTDSNATYLLMASTQKPVNRGIDKKTIIHLLGLLFSHKEWNLAICNIMISAGNHHDEQSKPVSKA